MNSRAKAIVDVATSGEEISVKDEHVGRELGLLSHHPFPRRVLLFRAFDRCFLPGGPPGPPRGMLASPGFFCFAMGPSLRAGVSRQAQTEPLPTNSSYLQATPFGGPDVVSKHTAVSSDSTWPSLLFTLIAWVVQPV
jgi:hypothetical protein